jgi:Rieske Fe-S protein
MDKKTDQRPLAMPERREILKTAVGLGLSIPLVKMVSAATEDDPKNMAPQIGDHLALQSGDKAGEAVKPDDLAMGGPQQIAFPMDPASGIVRDGSLLNMLILIRLDPGELKKKTLDNSVEGVVAYSAVCTHQACPVSMWREDKKALFCSCHGSQFDPKDGAKVVFGPAKNRLATLPVKMEDGVLVVAGKFTRRVGADKR